LKIYVNSNIHIL